MSFVLQVNTGALPVISFVNKVVACPQTARVAVLLRPSTVNVYLQPSACELKDDSLIQNLRLTENPEAAAWSQDGNILVVVTQSKCSVFRLTQTVWATRQSGGFTFQLATEVPLLYTPCGVAALAPRPDAEKGEAGEHQIIVGGPIGVEMYTLETIQTTVPADEGNVLPSLGHEEKLVLKNRVAALSGVFPCQIVVSPSQSTLVTAARSGLLYFTPLPLDGLQSKRQLRTPSPGWWIGETQVVDIASWACKDIRVTSIVFQCDTRAAVCTWNGEVAVLRHNSDLRWHVVYRVASGEKASPGAWCCWIGTSLVTARCAGGTTSVLMTYPPGNVSCESENGDGGNGWSSSVFCSLSVEVRGVASMMNNDIVFLTAGGDLRLLTLCQGEVSASHAAAQQAPEWMHSRVTLDSGRSEVIVAHGGATLTVRDCAKSDSVDSATQFMWTGPGSRCAQVEADFLEFSELVAAKRVQGGGRVPRWPIALCTADAIAVVYSEVAFVYTDSQQSAQDLSGSLPSGDGTFEWTAIEMPDRVVTVHLQGRLLVTLTATGVLQLWSPIPSTSDSDSCATVVAQACLPEETFSKQHPIIPIDATASGEATATKVVLLQDQQIETRMVWCELHESAITLDSVTVPIQWKAPPTRDTIILSDIFGFDIIYSNGDGKAKSLWAVHRRKLIFVRKEPANGFCLFCPQFLVPRAFVGLHIAHPLRPPQLDRQETITCELILADPKNATLLKTLSGLEKAFSEAHSD